MSHEELKEATFHRDLMDLLTEASKTVETQNIDGKPEAVITSDYESLYWQTREVHSKDLARFILKVKKLIRLSEEAKYNMMPERAAILVSGIHEIVKGYKHSIDGMASQSVRPDGTTQSTLVDKLAKHRSEKAYSAKEKMERGMFRSLVAKDDSEE